MEKKIRKLDKADVSACMYIYNYYIENTTCTLELEPLTIDVFENRFSSIPEGYPVLVCVSDNDKILGYAYLHPFSPRGGYVHTAELTVYVDKDAKGLGVGRALVDEIIIKSKDKDIRDIISVVTGENEGSLAFHKKMGFCDTAEFPGIAEKFGRRFSVHYLQLKLN